MHVFCNKICIGGKLRDGQTLKVIGFAKPNNGGAMMQL